MTNTMRELEVLDLPNEVWMPIVGDYGDKYHVSNLGRVKSLARNITLQGVRIPKVVLLKPSIRHLYYAVYLPKDGKIYATPIHRAVAQAFIPNPENKPYVNHKDLNKLNNHVDNLEWCTPLENIRHAAANGVSFVGSRVSLLGERNPKCKISDIQVREIVDLYNNRKSLGILVKEIAAIYGIDKDMVSDYAKGVYRKEATNA